MASPEGKDGGIVMRAAGAGAGAGARTPAPAGGGGSKRIEVSIKKAGSGVEEKLHTWPFLVRNEFLTQDRRRFLRPGIGDHIPVWISADEVTGRENVENATPPVGVHRHRSTRWHTSVEKSDSVVLERDRVESWRSDHGVEIIGPRPSRQALAPVNGMTAVGVTSPFDDTPTAAICRVSLNRSGRAFQIYDENQPAASDAGQGHIGSQPVGSFAGTSARGMT